MKALARRRPRDAAPPIFVAIYGAQKLGKTTFAASAPKPLFYDGERGTWRLQGVESVSVPSTLTELFAELDDMIANGMGEFETLVFDPLTTIEQLIWDRVISEDDKKWNAKSIQEVAGGFGGGYSASDKYWLAFLARLEAIREKHGTNIIVVDHVGTVKRKNPSGDDWQGYTLAVQQRAAALFAKKAEAVLYAYRPVTVFKSDAKDRGPAKAREEEAPHMLLTQGTAVIDAGNRYGLPRKMPLDWSEFWAHYIAPQNIDQLRAEATDLLSQVKDEAYVAKNAPKIPTLSPRAVVQAISSIKAKIEAQNDG